MDRNLIETENFIRKWTILALVVGILLPILKPAWVDANITGVVGKSFQYHVTHWLFQFFFFHVILEARKERLSPNGGLYGKKIFFPLIAAGAGVFGPMFLSGTILGDYSLKSGILITTATDIAFVIFAMKLAGLKPSDPIYISVVALAVVDDLCGIGFISILKSISPEALYVYVLSILLVIIANKFDVLMDKYFSDPMIWILLVIYLTFIFHSVEIHTTLAGVFVGLMVPYHPAAKRIAAGADKKTSVYYVLEHNILKDLIGVVIVPLFIVTSLAIHWSRLGLDDLINEVALAIFVGLFIGKTVFIFLAGYLLDKYTNFANLPSMWKWFFASMLCGVGLTVSMFFIPLSNVDETAATVSVLVTSFTAFTMGVIGLRFVSKA